MTNERGPEGAQKDFAQLLAELEAQARASRPPTRFHARALLLALGEALLAEQTDAAAAFVARFTPLHDAAREAWRKAIDEELALACTEHVRSCDPRFLAMPRYDFPYTVAARHRLEARFQAAETLGLSVGEPLLEQVARADEILAPYLRRAGRT